MAVYGGMTLPNTLQSIPTRANAPQPRYTVVQFIAGNRVDTRFGADRAAALKYYEAVAAKHVLVNYGAGATKIR